jgi:hypothetical protein
MPNLRRLHQAFLVAIKFALPITSCDRAPEAFSEDNKPSLLCPTKISAYITDVTDLLIRGGIIGSRKELVALRKNILGSKRIGMADINGKFLMRLFYHHLRQSGLIKNVRMDQMTMRFSYSSRLTRLRSFRSRVEAYIRP